MNTHHKKIMLSLTIMLAILLSGCMYPSDEKAVRENPYADQVETVQKAVDSYHETNNGLLPIKTRDLETDRYIKYPIDFSKIVPAFTEKIPSNAYENGGIFQYILVDVDENPTVKLVDLRTAERIRELHLRRQINGNLPFKEAVGENVYEIDYKKMGFEAPLMIESPYSTAQLPIIVSGDGNFYVDYSIDLNRILNEQNPEVKPGDDIRFLLEEESLVVPAYSLPYTVNEQNEPVFMANIPGK